MREEGSVEHPVHPTADVYLRVGAVLVILTVLEVGVFYVPAFHPVLVPVLLHGPFLVHRRPPLLCAHWIK